MMDRGDTMANILIVEDEKATQDVIADYMVRGGHVCFTADDGIKALVTLESHPMDLMILDVMMPYLDGLSLCRAAREAGDMPVILLAGDQEKLKGYDCGAGGYLIKPFSPEALLDKVNALLRPAAPAAPAAVEGISVGKITVQPGGRRVYLDGQELTLTQKEYELLIILMANPGQVFSREQLLSCIWGDGFHGSVRTVDAHVKALRQKLGDEGGRVIQTRSGYKFGAKA